MECLKKEKRISVNSRIDRVIIIVLDGVGIGETEDAEHFRDKGANTLLHISDKKKGGLVIPNLKWLGLGNIALVNGIEPIVSPNSVYGKMMPASNGKDSITGHWEMVGTILKDLKTYTNGFPNKIINEVCHAIGHKKILGNKTLPGEEIIKEFGEENYKTGAPIIYTSDDSAFKIASHVKHTPINTLYEMGKKALKVCKRHKIARVITFPIQGENGLFYRDLRLKRDFAMEPPNETALDLLKKRGIPIIGIGKIGDIFCDRGISRSIPAKCNDEGMKVLFKEIETEKEGVIFLNLVDFDSYSHRHDKMNFAKAMEEFDEKLEVLIESLREKDLLILTADHGCDPTVNSTFHTREYVPLLIYSKQIRPSYLGTCRTFADIGATLLDIFSISHSNPGESILNRIKWNND